LTLPANSESQTHLFISKTGRLLETWHGAFPHAISLPIDHLANTKLPIQGLIAPSCIWLRLSTDMTVALQIAAARGRFPDSHLVVLSDIPNDLEALAAFSVAARGYCNSHAGIEVLHNVANVVRQGGLWIGESIMQRLLTLPGSVSELTPATSGQSIMPDWNQTLTGREREVAHAIAEGANNRDIASALQITERTVKAHVSAILEKLRIKSRLQLALIVKNR
jgi:DNA-binding NarL/FixJ family response regulator